MLSMTTKFDFLNSFDATVVQSFDDHIVKGGKFAPQRRRYSSIVLHSGWARRGAPRLAIGRAWQGASSCGMLREKSSSWVSKA